MALGRDEVLKATVMELFARSSDLMANLPFEDITGNALKFDREKMLPGVAFRGVNEAYTESTGEVEKVIESLAIAGGDLDVDVFLVKTGGANQRAIQEQLKIKALSLNLTKQFIKGDVDTDPKGFDGLQVRCTGDQLINSSATAGSTAALSLAKLDEVIDAVDEPTHLIMNKTMRRRLSSAARVSTVGGYITYDLDAFGRRVTRYNDIPILIADKDEDNQEILAFTESGSGDGTEMTSIYCVSFAENGVLGLQNAEMDVRDLGEQQSKPVYRTRVEWYITLAILRPLAAARLYGLPNSAVTA
ncbi:MAG: major capsid protein [Candidatus Paceibacterota bacterium]